MTCDHAPPRNVLVAPRRAPEARAENLVSPHLLDRCYAPVSTNYYPVKFSLRPTCTRSKFQLGNHDPLNASRGKFFQRGRNHLHFKKIIRFLRAVKNRPFFGTPRRKRKLLRRLKLKHTVSEASAEGASENVGIFRRTGAHDVIFSNSGEGGKCPLVPPAGAHVSGVRLSTHNYFHHATPLAAQWEEC